jgi:predicted amidohydrolase
MFDAMSELLRVAAAQLSVRAYPDWGAFAAPCEGMAATAAGLGAGLLVYPEMVTHTLLPLLPAASTQAQGRRLDELTPRYLELFGRLARTYRLDIVGGSHFTVTDGALRNIAYLFRRDGSIETQAKLHVTPGEAERWGVAGGDALHVFDVAGAKLAILICYDVEFPELARLATKRGADLICVPYNTDLKSGYVRVRTCAQARCIENSLYAVLAGPVGTLTGVEGVDIHWGQACVLTPSDIALARDGVAEEATPNVETLIVADLDLAAIRRHRASGTVRTWADRRTDLYRVRFVEDGTPEDV